MAGMEFLGTYASKFAGGSIMNLLVGLIFGMIVLGIVIWFAWYMMFKKIKWNLQVEFKFPRSDGKIVNGEWGKGSYNTKRGVVLLKRKRMTAVPMPPCDVKKYLQGNNVLTVIQVGAEQYVPVMPDTFTHLQDDETGEEAAIMDLKVDLSRSKAWRTAFERESKQAYTIMTLLQQYANFIGWGIILFMNFVGFSILYSRITG